MLEVSYHDEIRPPMNGSNMFVYNGCDHFQYLSTNDCYNEIRQSNLSNTTVILPSKKKIKLENENKCSSIVQPES